MNFENSQRTDWPKILIFGLNLWVHMLQALWHGTCIGLPNPKFSLSYFSSPTPCCPSLPSLCPFSESLVGPGLHSCLMGWSLCSRSLSLWIWLLLALCSCLSGFCAGSLSCLLDLSAWFWFPPYLIDGFNAICDCFFCCGGPSLTSASIWLASCQLVVRVVVPTAGML